MRKTEIAKIVVLIHREPEPLTLLRKFKVEFPTYAPLFQKFYTGHLMSNILKEVYTGPMIKSFKNEKTIFEKVFAKGKKKAFVDGLSDEMEDIYQSALKAKIKNRKGYKFQIKYN